MSSWLKVSVFLVVSLLAANYAAAVEESSLPVRFQKEILPFLEGSRFGTFTGKDGVAIAWRAIPPAHTNSFQGAKALVIVNGRAEFMRKYAEVAYDLQKTGFSIYLLDNRGQGESARLLDEHQLGHVKNFGDYVTDLETFMNEVVLKDHPSEVHMLGHSMGGSIATIYAIEHPGVLRSMVLSSPMYQPNLGKYSPCVALAIADFMKLIGKGADIALGRKLDEWKTPFEANKLTHSANRYADSQKALELHPDNAVGGPTYRWVHEAIRSSQWIQKNAEHLTTPVRILQAGSDQIVITSFQNQVCAKAQSCDLQVYPGSNHEMLMETDSIRDRAMSDTITWLEKHSASAAN